MDELKRIADGLTAFLKEYEGEDIYNGNRGIEAIVEITHLFGFELRFDLKEPTQEDSKDE